jgi:hypothetical protein
MGNDARSFGRGARVVVLAAVAASWGSACGGSEFAGTAGLDGGVESDASTPSDASTALDAPVTVEDATTSEGGARDGGGVDASDGAALPFSCLTEPKATTLFCADFDRVLSPGDGWNAPVAFGGGKNALDPLNHVSPPNGYAAMATATTTAASASLQASLTSAAATLEYSFAFLVKDLAAGPATPLTIARLGLGRGTARALLVDLILDASGLRLTQSTPEPDGGSRTQASTVRTSAGLGVWTRARIVVERSASPWTLRVFLDGASALETAALAAPTDPMVEIDVGIIFCPSPSGPSSITFDDVILRAP